MNCAICRSSVTGENPAILFTGKKGEEHALCDECAERMEILARSRNAEKLQETVDYIKEHLESVETVEVSDYLVEILVQNEGDLMPIMETKSEDGTGVVCWQLDLGRVAKRRDDTYDQVWIIGLKVFGWALFFMGAFLGILGGIVSMTYWPGLAFIFVAAGFVTGFLTLSAIMVYINMAENIGEIRNHLVRQNLKK